VDAVFVAATLPLAVFLRLSRMMTFLTLAVQTIYGIITAIQHPTSKTTNQRHYCIPSNLALTEY